MFRHTGYHVFAEEAVLLCAVIRLAKNLEALHLDILEFEPDALTNLHARAERKSVDVTQPLRANSEPVRIMTESLEWLYFDRAVFGNAVVAGVGQQRGLRLKNRFANAFAQIDVQLKRRYDLIPNLVETAKGYMKHERETLDAVISARNQAHTAEKTAAQDPGNAQAMQSLMGAEGALTGAMGRLFAVMEAYPDLKANQNMMQLTEELTSTENKVAFSRQAYNDSVMAYNTGRETFPSNIIAGMFNFGAAQLFEIEVAAEREAPKVSF